MYSSRVAFGVCVIVILANVLNIIMQVRYNHAKNSIVKIYTYQGHDYPETLPLSFFSLPEINVQIEESHQYPVAGLESDDKWLSLTTSSVGYVRLGEPNRLFMVTMFHELHCLRVLNLAFEPSGFSRTPGPIDEGHVKHCFDYIRQMILCAADITLEKGDFTQQHLSMENVGHTRTCRNWGMVYQEMEDNWNSWINDTIKD